MNFLNKSLVPFHLFSTILVLATGSLTAQSDQNCLSFDSPLSGKVLSVPSCTVSLRNDCDSIVKVELQARYVPENSDSAVVVSLGEISRPPFKLIWNTSNLPNQLFTGIGILAEATLANKEIRLARQEGIFLTHNPVTQRLVPVPYSHQISEDVEGSTLQFPLKDSQKSSTVQFFWNEKELLIQLTVKDPSFYSNQPGKNLSDAGVEILFDPARRKAPHPADSILFVVVPLSGEPYKIKYTANISKDGRFKLSPSSSRVDYTYNVELREFKGYSVKLHIPKEAFGKSIPDTIGCNIILRTLDDQGKVLKYSLAGGSTYEMYSPIFWQDFYKVPKSLLMNPFLQFGAFFIAGFLLSLIIYMIIGRFRKPQMVTHFERSEEDLAIFERVKTIVEQELIKKDLDINYVSKRAGLSVKKLNSLIRKNTGLTFFNYLMYSRTEVAKERLRSSRSSETSIADLCGFSNVSEMEKYFQKFYRTTPYKFRMEQQVA